MSEFIKMAYEHARNFREKFNLGNYCAKQLFEILDLLEKSELTEIKLIRTPLSDLNIAGFIAYKYKTFVIVTNTKLSYGNEVFTIVHEIYHLLYHRTSLQERPWIEPSDSYNSDDINEKMANAFAAELLIPCEDLKANCDLFTENRRKKIDFSIVVQLQQKYGVDYIAITRRLLEIGYIDEQEEKSLNGILEEDEALGKLTKQLGYSNELNIPSMDTYLRQKDLNVIKENYDNGYTDYDDLVRIFGYLGCEPETFGYEEDEEVTDEAKNFLKGLLG